MATETWRDFHPSLEIPEGLKNTRVGVSTGMEAADPLADIDFQFETYYDDGSDLGEDEVGDQLDVPGTFEIISQTVRIGPDGSQVVDVIIDVEEVQGAVKYEVRMSK